MNGPSSPGVECVWPVAAELGEGPLWDWRDQCLRFVDIKRDQLQRFDPASGARATRPVPGNPSFVVLAEGGGLLLGCRDRIEHLAGEAIEPLARIDMPATNRTNDACVDPAGRLWLGTMDDGEREPNGRLYRFDCGAVSEHGGDAVVTNGPAIGADGRSLYFVDSGGRRVWRYPLDAEGGLGERTLFVQLEAADGYPDGITIDADDHLWVALWDGWGVRRYAPDGNLVGEVALPCARVTKLAFGGPGLATAFVTTARAGLDAAALADQPLAGGLFAFDPGVAGVKVTEARLP